jgi:hypothetical protein
VTGGCCSESEHIPNKAKEGFLAEQLKVLSVFKQCLKDVLFSKGIRNGRLMDPWVGLRNLDHSKVWGVDQIQPKGKCYGFMVGGVLLTKAKIGGKRKLSTEGDPGTKTARLEQDDGSSIGRGGHHPRSGATNRGHSIRGGRGWPRERN